MKRLALALAFYLLCGPLWAQMVTPFPPPQGGRPHAITASATGTTSAISATLTGIPNNWTYICGFVVTSAGTTSATSGTITVTGVIGGTMSFIYTFVSSGQGVLGVALPGCITSSALNQSITVNVPGGGTGTTVAVSAWGYTN